MSSNPWDEGGLGVEATLQPVSAMENSGLEYGTFSNPGANCVYIENPLYVPMMILPGAEFGRYTPTTKYTDVPGIAIPPFSWASIPIGENNNVAYDYRAYNRILQQATSIPIGIRGPFARAFDVFTPITSYPSSLLTQPSPRLARCYFFDSKAPSVSKGTLFRNPPLAFHAPPVTTVGDSLTGPFMWYCSPDTFFGGSGVVAPFTPIASINNTGTTMTSTAINVAMPRCVITGVTFNITKIPATGTGWITAGDSGTGLAAGRQTIWWMDEFIFSGVEFPDIFWQPTWPAVPPVANIITANRTPRWYDYFRNNKLGSVYIPIPGARHFFLGNNATNASPLTANVDLSVIFWMSEY